MWINSFIYTGFSIKRNNSAIRTGREMIVRIGATSTLVLFIIGLRRLLASSVHVGRQRSIRPLLLLLWLLSGRMRMRRVVIVGHVEDLAPRGYVKHGDCVLGAANEDDAVIGDRDLRRERLGRERVELGARAIVDGQPLVLLVARVQVAIRRLGRWGAHQLGDRIRELLEATAAAVLAVRAAEYVQAAVARVRQEVRTWGKK